MISNETSENLSSNLKIIATRNHKNNMSAIDTELKPFSHNCYDNII